MFCSYLAGLMLLLSWLPMTRRTKPLRQDSNSQSAIKFQKLSPKFSISLVDSACQKHKTSSVTVLYLWKKRFSPFTQLLATLINSWIGYFTDCQNWNIYSGISLSLLFWVIHVAANSHIYPLHDWLWARCSNRWNYCFTSNCHFQPLCTGPN